MADSKYSTIDATLNSFELPIFSAASEPFGSTGFIAAMAPLGIALNALSLDMRLLTAGQVKLGEALTSLTAALAFPRSQLQVFSSSSVASMEAPLRLSSNVEPRSTSDSHRISTVHKAQNHLCTCDLTSLMHAPILHQTVLPMASPVSDRDTGKAMGLSQSAVFEKSLHAQSTFERKDSSTQNNEVAKSPTTPADPIDASLGRLRSAVIPDLSGLSAPIDSLSAFAEDNPKKAVGLAAVAVVLYSIASKLVESVVDEAFTNVAKKILKRGSSRKLFGLGRLIGEDDRGGGRGQNERSLLGASPNAGSPDQRDGRRGTQKKQGEWSTHFKSYPDGFGYSKGLSSFSARVSLAQAIYSKVHTPYALEVLPRLTTPAMAQARSLVKQVESAQVRSLVAPVNPVQGQSPLRLVSPAQATPLLGTAVKVGSYLSKRAQPLRLLEAGIGVAQGVASGDTKTLVSSAGTLAGSYAGAAAGAAVGTMIFPGVGTAIGGLLGGFAGSELGSMLGEKLGALVDRLGAPAQVSKDLANAQTQNQPINFSPSIQVSSTGADSAEQIRMVVAQQLQAQFHSEFVPFMSSNALATRRDAALTDGGV
ncbi:hypothetical protein [Pseudomonas sp. KK4]|uniref:hypothetical protein n=1 Tax=Pseudomonas sp. KK4 TaxID=1855729 RepID=UPI0009FB708E|nr:hypothetical protein [Pseudomonas sp. KK4]